MQRHYWNPFFSFPKTSLFLLALACIPLLLQLRNFQVSSEVEVLLKADPRNLESYEKVQDILADTEVLVVGLGITNLFTPEGMKMVREISERFEVQTGVVDVKSLTHSSRPVRQGFQFRMVPLIPAAPSPAVLAETKEFCLNHPLVRNVMVAEDGNQTVLTVTYRRSFETFKQQKAFHEEVDAVLRPFQDRLSSIHFLALPLVEYEVKATLLNNLRWFLPVAAVLVLLVIWIALRSIRLVLLALAMESLTIALFPGMAQWTGHRFNVFSLMLFPLLTGIQLTLLAHLFVAYHRARSKSGKRRAAVVKMLEDVFKPSLFAAITTAVALLSLTLSELEPVREFGLLGSLGIGLVFFFCFGPTLSCLILWGGADDSPRTEKNRNHREDSSTAATLSEVFADSCSNYRMAILIFAGLFVVLMATGLSRIRTDMRAVEFLSHGSDARTAVEHFDRHFGGINLVQIRFHTPNPGGINKRPFLEYLDSVHDFATSMPSVSAVYSYSQLMGMLNQVWEGGDSEALHLPENPWLINLFVLALQSRELPFLAALANETMDTAYLVLRMPDMSSDDYLRIIDEVLAYARTHRLEGVEVEATEGLHSILEADRRLLRSQLSSAGTTVLVIFGVLALLWRSLYLALVALVANLLPVGLGLSLAGYAGFPLNSITVMVGALALGIAVDDSVHFITYWQQARHRCDSGREVLRETFRAKGRPIFFTSLLLISILGVFALFSFPPIVHFGWMSATAFVAALLSVLVLLPALLVNRK